MRPQPRIKTHARARGGVIPKVASACGHVSAGVSSVAALVAWSSIGANATRPTASRRRAATSEAEPLARAALEKKEVVADEIHHGPSDFVSHGELYGSGERPGGLLREAELHGGRPSKSSPDGSISLRDLGIDRRSSSPNGSLKLADLALGVTP